MSSKPFWYRLTLDCSLLNSKPVVNRLLKPAISNLDVRSVRLMAKLVVPALLGWSLETSMSAYGVPGGGGGTKSLPRKGPVTRYSNP